MALVQSEEHYMAMGDSKLVLFVHSNRVLGMSEVSVWAGKAWVLNWREPESKEAELLPSGWVHTETAYTARLVASADLATDAGALEPAGKSPGEFQALAQAGKVRRALRHRRAAAQAKKASQALSQAVKARMVSRAFALATDIAMAAATAAAAAVAAAAAAAVAAGPALEAVAAAPWWKRREWIIYRKATRFSLEVRRSVYSARFER